MMEGRKEGKEGGREGEREEPTLHIRLSKTFHLY